MGGGEGRGGKTAGWGSLGHPSEAQREARRSGYCRLSVSYVRQYIADITSLSEA